MCSCLIIQVILISDVVIISMLMFASDKDLNIWLAYPGTSCMPVPTMLILDNPMTVQIIPNQQTTILKKFYGKISG